MRDETTMDLDSPVFREYLERAAADNVLIAENGLQQSRDGNPLEPLETLCSTCGEQSWNAWRTGYCEDHYPGRKP